jgi:peptide deformylase
VNTAGIVQVPDPVLRARCLEVTEFDKDFREFAARLCSAAWEAGRVGVAAPQIGVALRAFAAKVDDTQSPRLFVNPRLKATDGTQTGREGCLSVAERWFVLTRANWVRVSAQDVAGEWFEVESEGLGARALQHEIDHLDGVLVIDRAREQLRGLPRQQRRAIERELAKVRP